MTIFVNFFERNVKFWEFFYIQMAIFRRVRYLLYGVMIQLLDNGIIILPLCVEFFLQLLFFLNSRTLSVSIFSLCVCGTMYVYDEFTLSNCHVLLHMGKQRWLVSLMHMLQLEKNKRHIPSQDKKERNEKFFETLKAAMTLNLQEMLRASLLEYKSLFVPDLVI